MLKMQTEVGSIGCQMHRVLFSNFISMAGRKTAIYPVS